MKKIICNTNVDIEEENCVEDAIYIGEVDKSW